MSEIIERINKDHPLYPQFRDFYHSLLAECAKFQDEGFRLYADICWTCYLNGARANDPQSQTIINPVCMTTQPGEGIGLIREEDVKEKEKGDRTV